MKNIGSLTTVLATIAIAISLIGCDPSENDSVKNVEQNIIVLLKFKAQPDKSMQTISELTRLIEKVMEEPNFVEIKLHIDPQDNTNIMLYEEWEDQDYYNSEHMNTDHIKEFMANSRNFLTEPPDITFWKVTKEFR